MPSSPSSPTASTWVHDVFLSFRGDTRPNFTDHLYHGLKQKGINTFRDEEKLEKAKPIGPEILKAIDESKFAVVVLSEDYASSTWCLDELAHIVQRMKERALEVIPVFYHVETSEVRKQLTGKFRDAFVMHEEIFKNEIGKVDKWRNALKEIANVNGWDLQNRKESEVIQEIAKKISNVLNKASSANSALIGMDSRVSKMESYLDLNSLIDVRTVGIWGMGGVGKTTLALEVFKKIGSHFESSCFVGDVRLKSREVNGLIHLQKIICSSLLNIDENIQNRTLGVDLLTRRLGKLRVLIILDDVDDLKQIEALPAASCLGPGSRVLVTTRDKDTLKKCRLPHDKIYEVEKLTDDEAFKLLCQTAFDQNQAPDNDYKELSHEFVKYADGLPLALEVLGSYLNGREVTKWPEALARLHKYPEEGIDGVLRISFDGLTHPCKEIFLDIACFFRGEDQGRVTKILKTCGFFPDNGLWDLINKSLIKIERDRLWMHDLIQKMGWNIVRQKSAGIRRNPGERSRLWVDDDENKYESGKLWHDEVLGENKGTDVVEGIYLSFPKKERIHLKADPFARMGNLRLLKIRNVEFSGCLEYNLSNNLRVLEWHECPLESMPSGFQPNQLVELKMPNSRIKQVWNEKFSLETLVLLDLSNCKCLTKTPDFSKVPKLERLILEGCEKLSEVDPTIRGLKHLVLLNMKGCESLERLPNSISLKSLKTLILSGCSSLIAFPDIMGNMESLAELYLDGTAIEELPISIGQLKGLIMLSLKGCESLLSLPSILCSLTSLKYLHLSGCSSIELLPESLGALECLEVLDACQTAIRKVPSSIGYLTNLKRLCLRRSKGGAMEFSEFRGWLSPKYSPPDSCSLISFGIPHDHIGCHFSLQHLDMSEKYSSANIMHETICEHLQDETPTGKVLYSTLKNVINNSVSTPETNNAHFLERDSRETSGLPNLRDMKFSHREFVYSSIPLPSSLFGLSFLISLDLSDCNLAEIPGDLGCLSSLQDLDLSENPIMNLPESISKLSNLRQLHLFFCRNLLSLPDLPSSLEFIDARYCLMLTTHPNGSTIILTSNEGLSFTNYPNSGEYEDMTRHPPRVHEEHTQHLSVYIEDQIHHEQPFQIRFLHTRIPEYWCGHSSSGSSLTAHLPADNSMRMGFALFVVLEILDNDSFDKSWELQETLCHFHTHDGCLEKPLVFQNFNGFTAGSYLLCCYEPRGGQFGGYLSEASGIRASVSSNRQDVAVKWCGIHPITQQDAEKFVQDLTQIANQHSDLHFVRHCEGLLDKAIELETSGDVMVLGYNLQEAQCTSTVNQGSCRSDYCDFQPSGEPEPQLSTLLSILYKERNGREKNFYFCFPAPLISSWFFHHYVGDVAICYLPENLLDDKRWVGLELYAAFTWGPSISSDHDTVTYSILDVDLCAHERRVIHSSVKIHSSLGSYQLVILHVPRMHFPQHELNHCQGISTFFRATTPEVEVQVCGSRLVYEQDLDELIRGITECTLGKSDALDELYSRAQKYVKSIHEAETVERYAAEGEMPNHCDSSFQRSVKQVEVPDQVPSSKLHKYGCYLKQMQGLTEPDRIIVHSKRCVLDYRDCIQENVVGKDSVCLLPHLHILAETQLYGSYNSEQRKKSLKLLLGCSEVASFSLRGHMISVLKHFNPSATYNFCSPQKENILEWFKLHKSGGMSRVGITLPPKLDKDDNWRGLAICTAFSMGEHPTATNDNVDSEKTLKLLCHLDTNEGCLNPVPLFPH